MSILEALTQPFMLRAIYGGLLVAVICAILGVFVTLRKQSFLTDGIAHASLAGIALGILLSFQPVYMAFVVAIIMAVGITYLQNKDLISFDATIGILYSVLFAAGILLISIFPSYRPDLFTYLFGSILTVSWTEIIITFITLVVTVVVITLFYKRIVYITFDPDAAFIRGVRLMRIEYILNILTSIAVIVAIKLVGVVLVTALMIIPATAAKLMVKTFNQMIPYALVYTIVLTFSGIIASYFLNAPSGAVVVVLQGIILFLVLGVKIFR